MTAADRRIARLRRLERLRAVAKRQAASETAQAEDVLTQLRALTERTRRLAEDYVGRDDALDGYMLAQSSLFAAGLCQIVNSTGLEANCAQERADRKMAELASAERRRAAVEQRLDIELRNLAQPAEIRLGAVRKKFGMDFE